jgi:hypothetical protein
LNSGAPQSSYDHLKTLSKSGPFTAKEAEQHGLITGCAYRTDAVNHMIGDERGKVNLLQFFDYATAAKKNLDSSKEAIKVGVVYLLGTIGDTGE